MSIYVVRIRDINGFNPVDIISKFFGKNLDRDEEAKNELFKMADSAIELEYIPAYVYVKIFDYRTAFIASTTGAWAWFIHFADESDDKQALSSIGYEELVRNILVKWVGYAAHPVTKRNGTFAWIVSSLACDNYELLRVISS